MLVHSIDDRTADINPHNQLDSYTHDPEPPQDPIQIGDRAIVLRGPRAGLLGKIMSIALPHVWVEPLTDIPTVDNNEFGPRTCRPIEPMVGSQRHLQNADDIFEWGDTDLIMVYVHDAEIEPPATLTYSQRSGYDVTIGDLVSVVRGQHLGRTGVVVSVDFRNACMEICDGEKVSKTPFPLFF